MVRVCWFQVNKLDEESLSRILWKYGEERLHKKIAHGIVFFRSAHGPIKTTKQLGDILATIVKQYFFIFDFVIIHRKLKSNLPNFNCAHLGIEQIRQIDRLTLAQKHSKHCVYSSTTS